MKKKILSPEALEHDLAAVSERAASLSKDDLLATLARLDSVLGDHGPSLHPRLRHYLEGRSYAKALVLLREGQDRPGTCGGQR